MYARHFVQCPYNDVTFAQRNSQQYALRLKGGLFWYGHHPEMHEMASSTNEFTGQFLHASQNAITHCFNLQNYQTKYLMINIDTHMSLFVQQIFEKPQGVSPKMTKTYNAVCVQII